MGSTPFFAASRPERGQILPVPYAGGTVRIAGSLDGATGYKPDANMKAGPAPDMASKAPTFEVSCFRDVAPLVRDRRASRSSSKTASRWAVAVATATRVGGGATHAPSACAARTGRTRARTMEALTPHGT